METPIEPRQALYAHLLADARVNAAVSTRVYQRRVPLGAVKPLILIYPPIITAPTHDLDGVAWLTARLQVTAFACDDPDTGEAAQPQAERAARAVIAAVNGFSGLMAGKLRVIQATVDSDHQADQEETDEIRHHVDVVIKYKE